MKKPSVLLITLAALVGTVILPSCQTPKTQWSTRYSFDQRNRPVLSGHVDDPSMHPKLGLRASGAIYMLAVYGPQPSLGLAVSTDGGDSFSPPVSISTPEARVMSHGANSPVLAIGPEEIYALWEQRSETGIDLMFARSIDYAYSFEEPTQITDKTHPSWNGFSALKVAPNGHVYAAWLDGRDAGDGRPGTAALYLSRSQDLGVSFEKNRRLALDVCPCCRPAISFGESGEVLVAWRSVFEGDIRDIVVARSDDAGETFGSPVRVAEDGWRINGCPHSGPSIVNVGNCIYIAWFSEGRGSDAGVRLAWSDDGGNSFAPHSVVSGDVLDSNQPNLSVSPDGKLFMVFQGRSANAQDGWGVVRPYLAEIDPGNRKVSDPVEIPGVEQSVSYPTLLAGSQGRVYLTWTERMREGSQVQFRRMRLLH